MVIKKKKEAAMNSQKKNEIRQNALNILSRGEDLGKTIMGVLSLVATNKEGMGIATIGMAMALAALKNIARDSGVDIEHLYASELAFHGEEMTEVLAEMDWDM